MEGQQRIKAGEPRRRARINRIFIGFFVGFFIFLIGLNIGNGSIQIGGFGNSESSQSTPGNLDYSSVEQVYDSLRSSFDGELDEVKLTDGMKKGLVQAAGDPYTEYFDEQAAKEFNEQLSGEFSGIGAELGVDSDGNVIVISPIAGFPAEKAGMRSQDIIVNVNDEQLIGATVSEAVSKIRGPEGTTVKIKVVRDRSQELDFEIVRAIIKVPSVTSEILPDNIGYLKVARFGDDTVQLVQAAAKDFTKKGVTGIVLDMRQDPGGLLDAAVDISSLWLPSGTKILEEKRGEEVIKTYRSSGNAPLKGVKTVVLIDEGSASASEIVAGALSDNNAATLIGVKSYGKGSVQTMDCLDSGRTNDGQCLGPLLKITIARWYTPNGRNIDKEGIEPSQVVERTSEDIQAGRDPQKDAAVQALKQ